MVHTLEAIKGGGGSIKVGNTGTISSLMSRELESMKYAPQIALSSRNKSSAATIMAPGAKTSPNRLKPRTSDVEASCSSSSINYINHESVRKAKNYTRKPQNVPMLNAGNMSLDATPIRKKSEKKGPNIVEIVDIRCGHPDRGWANPIANRLEKLSFSKLSDSIN